MRDGLLLWHRACVGSPNTAPLTQADIERALSGSAAWQLRDHALEAAYGAATAAEALEFVAAIGRAAEAANHHPDVNWRYTKVFVRATTHSAGHRVTAKDIELAAVIDGLAQKAGLHVLPASPAGSPGHQ